MRQSRLGIEARDSEVGTWDASKRESRPRTINKIEVSTASGASVARKRTRFTIEWDVHPYVPSLRIHSSIVTRILFPETLFMSDERR